MLPAFPSFPFAALKYIFNPISEQHYSGNERPLMAAGTVFLYAIGNPLDSSISSIVYSNPL